MNRPLPLCLSTYVPIVRHLFVSLFVLSLAWGLVGCDSGISGTQVDNIPPTVVLSVQDTSLVGQIQESERLASAVALSWTGTDADGFVAFYELRFYPQGESPAPWIRTARQDTVVVLPVRGGSIANVIVEVRATDNEGATGGAARTIFPIRNSPPTLALTRNDRPADTTWTAFSFGFDVNDPEGPDNIAAIEVAFNDTTLWTILPPATRFVLFRADVPVGAATEHVEARVYTGRTVSPTDIRVPNLRVNGTNRIFIRARDQANAVSPVVQYPNPNDAAAVWYVKRPRTRVLLVNDYRRDTHPRVMAWHRQFLTEFLGFTPDTWNIQLPLQTGSTGTVPRSPALGATGDPALAETFALFDHIYWVSTSTTNSPTRNNLPVSVPALDKFLAQGGTVMVHSPISVPPAAELEENLNNPALFLLPISALVPVPDSLRSLSLDNGAVLSPQAGLPNDLSLPTLRTASFILTTLPYAATDSRTRVLYSANFSYQTRVGNRRGTWTGSSAVASLRLNEFGLPQVGLFTLPVINETNGNPIVLSPDGNAAATREALRSILQSLRF